MSAAEGVEEEGAGAGVAGEASIAAEEVEHGVQNIAAPGIVVVAVVGTLAWSGRRTESLTFWGWRSRLLRRLFVSQCLVGA